MDPLVQWLTTARTVPAVAHMAITSHQCEAYFVAFPITFMPRSSDTKPVALTTVARVMVALVMAAVDTPLATAAAVTQPAMAAAAIRPPTEAVATAHRTEVQAASPTVALVTVALALPTAVPALTVLATVALEPSITEPPTAPLPTQFSMLHQAAL